MNATIRRLLESPATDARTLLATHAKAIREIMRRHRIRKLVAFGSRARGTATPASDLDLAASFDARATSSSSPTRDCATSSSGRASPLTSDARWLRDIVEASDEIASYVQGIDLEGFVADRMRQRAIERLLTIVGEAAKNLSEATRGAIRQPWREIIRFRDKGIQAYDSLTPSTIYRIATESIPDLRSAVATYLRRT